MPTDLAVAMGRKREALKFQQNIRTILLGCGIACLAVLVLICVSPTLAGAVESLVIQ